MANGLVKILDVIDEIIESVRRRTNEPDLAAAVVNIARRTKELEARVGAIESDLSDEVTPLEEKVKGALVGVDLSSRPSEAVIPPKPSKR